MHNGKSWSRFSKYHYLSDRLPGGKNRFYGLFIDGKQVGFQCYNAYIPGKPHILYSNRVVIDPDYQGFGLGLKFINITARHLHDLGFKIRASFSSYPLYKARLNDSQWRLREIRRDIKVKPVRSDIGRSSSMDSIRNKVTMYCFEYVG